MAVGQTRYLKVDSGSQSAALSAQQAAASANAAASSAASASNSAAQAATSANQASNQASSAATSASNASTSEANAAQSESNAQQYATDAEAAKDAAETAQAEAEQLLGNLGAVNPRGDYTTATAYTAFDAVFDAANVLSNPGAWYLAMDGFTSTDIASDVAVGDLVLFQISDVVMDSLLGERYNGGTNDITDIIHEKPSYSSDADSLIACGIVRQPTAGGGWGFIDDANHRTQNFASVSYGVTNSLELDVFFDFTLNKIGSVSTDCDEKFSRILKVGASVKTDRVALQFFSDMSLLINNETETFALLGDNYHDSSEITVTNNNDGTVTVNHPLFSTYSAGEFPAVSAADDANGQYEFYAIDSVSGNDVTYAAYANLGGRIRRQGNDSSWTVNVNSASTATASFSGGVLTVSHEDVGEDAPINNLTLYGTSGTIAYAKVNSVLGSGFEVRFFNSSGTLVTVGDNTMDFSFRRGGRLVKKSTATGRTLLKVKNMATRPQNIKDDSGNVWIMGVFEV